MPRGLRHSCVRRQRAARARKPARADSGRGTIWGNERAIAAEGVLPRLEQRPASGRKAGTNDRCSRPRFKSHADSPDHLPESHSQNANSQSEAGVWRSSDGAQSLHSQRNRVGVAAGVVTGCLTRGTVAKSHPLRSRPGSPCSVRTPRWSRNSFGKSGGALRTHPGWLSIRREILPSDPQLSASRTGCCDVLSGRRASR